MGLPRGVEVVTKAEPNKFGVVEMQGFRGIKMRAGFSWGNTAVSMVGESAIMAKNKFLTDLGLAIPPRLVLKSVNFNNDQKLVVTQDNLSGLIATANGHGIQTHADVLVTDIANLSLMVTPADCTVAVLYGQSKEGRRTLGMAHAGWRETINLVPAVVVQEMAKMGCDPSQLVVGIAPSIMQKNFWVKPKDMRDEERKRWGGRTKDDKVEKDGEVIKLDVLGRVIDIMVGEGVPPINILAYAVDTFEAALAGKSYSHRASVVKGDPKLDGRFAVAAALTS